MKKITKIIFVPLLLVMVISVPASAQGLLKPDAKAPNFRLVTVDGDTVELYKVLADSEKVVLLNFFGWN